jgi:hypothetical protein
LSVGGDLLGSGGLVGSGKGEKMEKLIATHGGAFFAWKLIIF